MKSINLNSYIGQIYDAALDPSLWDQFMLDLTDAVDGTTGVLVMQHDRIPGSFLSKQTGDSSTEDNATTFCGRETLAKYTRFPSDVLDYYMAYYFPHNDIWFEKIYQHCKTGSVFIGSDFVLDSEIKKLDFYNEVLKQAEGGYLLSGILELSANNISGLSISRDMNKTDFDQEDKKFIQQLLPHLQRACQLHARFMDCLKSELALNETLYRHYIPTILLNSQGQVIFINAAAEKILQQADGLEIKKNKLHAIKDTQLDKFIHETINTAKHKSTHPGNGYKVSRLSGKEPYQIIISPFNLRSDYSMARQDSAVSIFIHDIDSSPILSKVILEDLYNLTSAEIKIAELFYQRFSLREIAKRLNISITTVRTHLYKIMEKTNTNSQTELMQLLKTSIKVM